MMHRKPVGSRLKSFDSPNPMRLEFGSITLVIITFSKLH